MCSCPLQSICIYIYGTHSAKTIHSLYSLGHCNKKPFSQIQFYVQCLDENLANRSLSISGSSVPRTQQGRRGTLRRARPGAPGACLRGHQQPEGSSNDSLRAPAASPPVSAERVQAGCWSVQTRAPTASISRSPRHQRPATPSPPSMSRSSWSVRPRVWSLVLVLVVARQVVCTAPMSTCMLCQASPSGCCNHRWVATSSAEWYGAKSVALATQREGGRGRA